MNYYLTKDDLLKLGVSEEQVEVFDNFFCNAKKGEVNFSYLNQDGDERSTRGTLSVSCLKEHPDIILDNFEMEYLEDLFTPTELVEGGYYPFTGSSSETTIVYFDTEFAGLRSLDIKSLIQERGN